MRTPPTLCAGAICLVLLASHARAAPVAVANGGFEDPQYNDGDWGYGVIDWDHSSGDVVGTGNAAGTWFPGRNGMAREHRNISGSNGGYLRQTVSTVQNATQYTLMVEVGYRLDVPNFPGYKVQLLAVDGQDETLLGEDSSPSGPDRGEWLTSTVAYRSMGLDPHAGKDLVVRLSDLGGGAQVNFDHVCLDARPSSYQPFGELHVTNPGFEATPLGYAGEDDGIAGWDFVFVEAAGNTTGTGVLRPTPDMFPGGAAEGENVAFSDGHVIRQVLAGEPIASDISYALSVEVGNRGDLPGFPGYAVQLLALDPHTGTSQLLSEDDNSLTIEEGEFQTSTVSYRASPLDPNLGHFLEIHLVGDGVQVNFDDVRLLAVPEPGMLVLLVIGGLVFLLGSRLRNSFD